MKPETRAPLPDSPRTPGGIKYVSLFEKSGYGEAARRYLLGLAQTGIPLTWCPMTPGPGWGMWYEPHAGPAVGDAELDPFCQQTIPYDTVIVHTVPEYFPHWLAREKGRRVFGYTTWETDRLPGHWPDLLNRMDGLLVPCEWNHKVFTASGVTVPIHVVPHIAPPPIAPSRTPILEAAEQDYVFYTINTWTRRKGVELALRAYLSAFRGSDPVVFVLRTSRDVFVQSRNPIRRFLEKRFRPTTARALQKLLRGRPDPARVILLCDELSAAEMEGLHTRGDAYISLSRGEGWGLGAFDAGAHGKPVIMAGHGGPLDYLSEDRAYLAHYRLTPVDDVAGRPSYTPDQRWAEPDVEHATILMRRVFERRDEAAEKGRRLRAYIDERFNMARVTGILLHSIRRP
jgi:glycosyltransferase involved in cell wall biosynthesis